MNQQVKRWGNSLAVRLPATLAAELGLRENDPVDIRRDGDGVRIEKVAIDDPTLEELLARITPENRHPETDWGPPVGKEIW
ncbi:MAG: AbrB/MazE/SpoVT family DNA-binding domain-containing protein [Sphingomicrobium sp.]